MSTDWISGAARWAWETSLFAAVLVGLVLLAQLAFGRWMSARARYGLSLLVLLRLLLPAAPESALSISNLAPAADEAPPVERAELPVAQITPPDRAWMEPLPPAAALPPQAAPVKPSGRAVGVHLPTLWLVGVLMVMIVALFAHWRMNRWLRRTARPASLKLQRIFRRCGGVTALLEVPGLHTAAVVGALRPRVIVPEGLSAKLSEPEIEDIFAHELAHLRKGDLLVNWLVVLAGALHWFNPLAWLGLRRLLADRELARDEDAVRGRSQYRRARYGRTLIKILETFQPARLSPGAAPVLRTKPEIRRRITMIASKRFNGRLAGLFCLLLALSLGAATFTTARAEDDEKKENREHTERKEGERKDGDRERKDGDRERKDGDRERKDGDREHAGERREGERDREREEGDRKDGDREHDGDRFERAIHDLKAAMHQALERGQKDKAHAIEEKLVKLIEARKRQQHEHERGEHSDGERGGDEFEHHVNQIKEKIEWLAENGKREDAAKLERHLAEMIRHREREERTDGERGGDEFERHVHELKEKVEWLAERGKKEEAEKLERHIHELLERHRGEREEHGERHHKDERAQHAEHIERRLHEMARHMEEMQRAMQEMRRELERLR